MAQFRSKQWIREKFEKLTKKQKTKVTKQFNNKNYVAAFWINISEYPTKSKAKDKANIEAKKWREFNNKVKIIDEGYEFVIYVEMPPPPKPISRLAQKIQSPKGPVHVKGHRRKATNVRPYTRRRPRR